MNRYRLTDIDQKLNLCLLNWHTDRNNCLGVHDEEDFDFLVSAKSSSNEDYTNVVYFYERNDENLAEYVHRLEKYSRDVALYIAVSRLHGPTVDLFRALSDRSGLIMVLDLTESKISLDSLNKIADMLANKKIHKLILSGVRILSEKIDVSTLTRKFSSCRDDSHCFDEGLVCLDLSNTRIGPAGECFINEIHSEGCLSTLRDLNLENIFLGGFSGNGPMARNLANAIRKSVSLQVLNIGRNNLSGFAMRTIFTALIDMSKIRNDDSGIRSLVLDKNSFDERAADSVGILLNACYYSLSSISMQYCDIDGRKAKIIAMKASATLQDSVKEVNNGFEMYLSYNRISPSGLVYLAESLIHSRRIHFTALHLRSNLRVGDESGDPTTTLGTFLISLATAPYLKVLDISGTLLPQNSLLVFFRTILDRAGTPTATSLMALNINHCQIGYQNAEVLFSYLKTENHSLRILCIGQNSLGNNGISSLYRVLQEDKLLRYVRVDERLPMGSLARSTETNCSALERKTVLRYEPWPFTLKYTFLLCTSLPQEASRIIFEFLMTPVVRIVNVFY